jgi:hypothetical protein
MERPLSSLIDRAQEPLPQQFRLEAVFILDRSVPGIAALAGRLVPRPTDLDDMAARSAKLVLDRNAGGQDLLARTLSDIGFDLYFDLHPRRATCREHSYDEPYDLARAPTAAPPASPAARRACWNTSSSCPRGAARRPRLRSVDARAHGSYNVGLPRALRGELVLSSSRVEHPAVNRRIVGSNPT